MMKHARIAAILFALAGIMVVGTPNLATARDGQGNCDGNCQQNGSVSGAPGPIAGAGLPILAVGYGVYWLIKRRRKAK